MKEEGKKGRGEIERGGRLSTLVELFPNPSRDLNGCQSFPVLGLVAREKLPSKGVKLAPVGPFRPTMRILGTNAGFVSGLQTICTRASKNAPLSFSIRLTFLAMYTNISRERSWDIVDIIFSLVFKKFSKSFREREERESVIERRIGIKEPPILIVSLKIQENSRCSIDFRRRLSFDSF